MKHLFLFIIVLLFINELSAQTTTIRGRIKSAGKPVEYATVMISSTNWGAISDTTGRYIIPNIKAGTYILKVSAIGFTPYSKKVSVDVNVETVVNIDLSVDPGGLNEVVITGTMKEISRTESPIPVEIITPKLFQKNPAPSLFESVGMINGVQPQLNCNVCNTGDIHINGMEGPYTMVLIDGMPIVSSLSSVYGLSGIPNSLVERIEVVKGPASSLYGSEAMGGIINVITKNPLNAPVISADVFATSWQEYSADAAVKFKAGKATGLLGINYFTYQHMLDKNKDGFTDVALQDRISVFNKWNIARAKNRLASIAVRYVYEDRWGGQTQWNKTWRGSDSIYGESIYTNRYEVIGMYQLPVKEKIITQLSYNLHDQNSYYGNIPYMANQQVAFGQMYWDKQFGSRHNFLLGGAFRYTYYDDNTPGTASADTLHPKNQPMETPLPGAFIQDEWTLTSQHKILLGYRYDYDKNHGNIHSPRVAYKWSPNRNHTIRGSFGTGFRVVNLFTEDHAALTGAREVIIAEKLNPERSYNSNLNYVLKIPTKPMYMAFDITAFYSYFTNRITGDFDSDPNKIIYDNLKGHAISQGISLNTDFVFNFPFKLIAGITYMNVYQMEDKGGKLQKSVQIHAPEWSGTFVATYSFRSHYTLDLTGKWTGPMRLPVLPNDYRPDYSPLFFIVNIQLTKKLNNGIELYGGIKNLFDFIPSDPIMRPFDPFNKSAADVTTNPNGYIFDPSYNYTSLQGTRLFLGVRYNLFR